MLLIKNLVISIYLFILLIYYSIHLIYLFINLTCLNLIHVITNMIILTSVLSDSPIIDISIFSIINSSPVIANSHFIIQYTHIYPVIIYIHTQSMIRFIYYYY